MARAVPWLPSNWFYPELVLSRHDSALFIFLYPAACPASPLYCYLSLPLSLSLSQPSLFQSLSKKNVSFEFYLKIAMGNTCNGCKNNSNKKKKCPPWLGNYLNHKEKKNIRRGIRMREKGDWKGINEFKKKEYPLPSTVSTVEERGYFTKGYWSSKLLTGFFLMRSLELLSPKKKGCDTFNKIVSFCLNILPFSLCLVSRF